MINRITRKINNELLVGLNILTPENKRGYSKN